MAILLALASAIAYGTSDFLAGLSARRYAAEPVTGVVVAVEVLGAIVAVVLDPGHGPRFAALAWGALAGLGGGGGVIFLYRGLASGAMAITGTASGVLAAVVPVIVGLALGNELHAVQAVGIVIAVPAIALVSWQPGPRESRAGTIHGVLAGVGFALQFIALDRAGTHSGAWPLVPAQAVSLLVVAPVALRGLRGAGRPPVRAIGGSVAAGGLAIVAVIAFLAATGHGELSIVAVVASLYPASTVLLARVALAERWSRLQAIGLLVAAASVVLVSLS